MGPNVYLIQFPELAVRDISHKLDSWQRSKVSSYLCSIFDLVLLVTSLLYNFRCLCLSCFFSSKFLNRWRKFINISTNNVSVVATTFMTF